MNLRTSVSKSMLLNRPGVGEKLRPRPSRVIWASVRVWEERLMTESLNFSSIRWWALFFL